MPVHAASALADDRGREIVLPNTRTGWRASSRLTRRDVLLWLVVAPLLLGGGSLAFGSRQSIGEAMDRGSADLSPLVAGIGLAAMGIGILAIGVVVWGVATRVMPEPVVLGILVVAGIATAVFVDLPNAATLVAVPGDFMLRAGRVAGDVAAGGWDVAADVLGRAFRVAWDAAARVLGWVGRRLAGMGG